MMNAISNSADHFFSTTSNWDILTVSELDDLLAQYPYFSLLHLLRARKLRLDGAEEDPKDFKKTTLYFNNIPWLMYQYNQQPIFSRPAEKIVPVVDIPFNDTIEQDIIDENVPINLIEVEETSVEVENQLISAPEALETLTEPIEQDIIDQDIPINLIDVDETSVEVENQLISAPEALETITEPIEMVIHQDEIAVEETVETIYEAYQYQESAEENVQESIEPIVVEEVEQDVTNFEVTETISEVESAAPIASEGEYIETTIDSVDSFIIENEAIIATREEISAPIIEQTYQLPIEDISGTDYFAAQGIKADNEVSPISLRLNLTQNSFTGWLKAMQQIENSDQTDQIQASTINNSQLFSIIDNEEIEVFTETMADVYIKQGLTKKAILIFEKLSLIYPTKSAYFASRIDKINTI